jgi:hypothetical protein
MKKVLWTTPSCEIRQPTSSRGFLAKQNNLGSLTLPLFQHFSPATHMLTPLPANLLCRLIPCFTDVIARHPFKWQFRLYAVLNLYWGYAEAVLKDVFLLRQMMRQPNWNTVHRPRIATDWKMDFVNVSLNVTADCNIQWRCTARSGFLVHQSWEFLYSPTCGPTQPPIQDHHVLISQEADHSHNTDANDEWILYLHFSILLHGVVQRFPNRVPRGLCKGFGRKFQWQQKFTRSRS